MHAGSPFSPASIPAEGIAHIFRISLIMCYAILALVSVLVIYASIRFRARGRELPPQQYGVPWIERLWTGTPILLLIGMFGVTVATIHDTDPPVPADPDLVVIGHQWWWEFRYPRTGIVSAYDLHIPLSRAMATEVRAADVIHDFAVMQLQRKIDAIPGTPRFLWVQADQPGSYLGFCHEYCGAGHAWMLFNVVAESDQDFEAWQRREALPAAAPQTPGQTHGRELFEKKTCANCHTIRGTDAKGTLGPDLTHIASRSHLGSGVLENSEHNLTLWLKDPRAQKPGALMPNMQLDDADLNSIVAYLENLK